MKRHREHIVHLSRQVVALFNELKMFTGKGPLCFPSPQSSTVRISDMILLNGLRRRMLQTWADYLYELRAKT
jgi:hypothetical protein